MDELQLLVDLHIGNERQGPGSVAETKRAVGLAMLDADQPLKIADIGCGTGAATLILAELFPNAEITAVDFLDDFLNVLKRNADAKEVSDRIKSLVCSMDELPFEENEFDVIWSEGAIYNMGFENGVEQWQKYLKPGGILAVSEITWLTKDRPAKLQKYWNAAYPEIDTASSKIQVLESKGYSPIGYFVLPEYCWLDNYYYPMEKRFKPFLEQYENSEVANAIVKSEKEEIALYEANRAYYSYGFYIAKKL